MLSLLFNKLVMITFWWLVRIHFLKDVHFIKIIVDRDLSEFLYQLMEIWNLASEVRFDLGGQCLLSRKMHVSLENFEETFLSKYLV